MASRLASVTSEEITQINDEAVPENPKKETKFGLAVFQGNGLTRSLSIKNQRERFCLQMQINLA